MNDRPARVEIKLVGADTCRRYQMMRELVLTEAARVGMSVEFIEETEAEGILKYRTPNLPLLFIGEEQVAAVNLPSRKTVLERLRMAARRQED